MITFNFLHPRLLFTLCQQGDECAGSDYRGLMNPNKDILFLLVKLIVSLAFGQSECFITVGTWFKNSSLLHRSFPGCVIVEGFSVSQSCMLTGVSNNLKPSGEFIHIRLLAKPSQRESSELSSVES